MDVVLAFLLALSAMFANTGAMPIAPDCNLELLMDDNGERGSFYIIESSPEWANGGPSDARQWMAAVSQQQHGDPNSYSEPISTLVTFHDSQKDVFTKVTMPKGVDANQVFVAFYTSTGAEAFQHLIETERQVDGATLYARLQATHAMRDLRLVLYPPHVSSNHRPQVHVFICKSGGAAMQPISKGSHSAEPAAPVGSAKGGTVHARLSLAVAVLPVLVAAFLCRAL